jgi:hypothetical protein
MCGRFTPRINLPAQIESFTFLRPRGPKLAPRFAIAPIFRLAPVRQSDKTPEISSIRWGEALARRVGD